MNPNFPTISLVSNGLYLSLAGDVVRVHATSLSQRVFHGSNDRAFFGNGLVIDPDGRDPAILRPDDLVVDALHLPDAYPNQTTDAEWLMARRMFMSEAYDLAADIIELDGQIAAADLAAIIDGWIEARPRFARWREFLLASFRFLGRAHA